MILTEELGNHYQIPETCPDCGRAYVGVEYQPKFEEVEEGDVSRLLKKEDEPETFIFVHKYVAGSTVSDGCFVPNEGQFQ